MFGELGARLRGDQAEDVGRGWMTEKAKKKDWPHKAFAGAFGERVQAASPSTFLIVAQKRNEISLSNMFVADRFPVAKGGFALIYFR
jgi:hypothetical protein